LSAPEKPLHVLIADDEPMLRSVIAEFLESLGSCTFAQACDGAEALEYLRAHPVDCLLSDARMPRMDLEQLLQVVGREFPETLVIGTSGYSDLESACRILELGAHEFLAKPLNLDFLEQSLELLPRRARVLRLAREAFGGSGRDMSLNYTHPFGMLDRSLGEISEPFLKSINHARRTADLADLLTSGDVGPIRNELRLAAMLHEIGCSSQQIALQGTSRALLPNERRFIRAHALVAGRFLDVALPGRHTGDIVRGHVNWMTENSGEEHTWNAARQLAGLLGVVNLVDGLLQDRPDRERHDIEAAHGILKKLYAETGLPSIKQALGHWPLVMSYYAETTL
jgi:CheY-like chemotaxis protein